MSESVRGELIAEWICDGATWNDFRSAELGRYWRSSRAALHFGVGAALLCLLVVAVIFLINSLVIHAPVSDAVGPSVIFVVGAGICLAVGMIVWTLRKNRDAAYLCENGKVQIFEQEASLNGNVFRFFGETHKLLRCTLNAVNANLTKFEVIDLEAHIEIPGRRTPITDIAHFRIPVPPDQLTKANDAVETINDFIRSRR